MDEANVKSLVDALDNISLSIFLLVLILGMALATYYFASILGWFGKKRESKDLFKFTVERADELFDSGKVDQLIDYASTCLDSYPNDIHARFYLGLAHFHKRNYSAALAEFDEVIRINPGWREHPLKPYLEEIQERLGAAMEQSQKH